MADMKCHTARRLKINRGLTAKYDDFSRVVRTVSGYDIPTTARTAVHILGTKTVYMRYFDVSMTIGQPVWADAVSPSVEVHEHSDLLPMSAPVQSTIQLHKYL
jgi:hypothetical protein